MGVSTWEHDARDHRAIWQTAALTLRARSFFFFLIPPYSLLIPSPHTHTHTHTYTHSLPVAPSIDNHRDTMQSAYNQSTHSAMCPDAGVFYVARYTLARSVPLNLASCPAHTALP